MKILAIETSCDDTGIAILETSDKQQEIRFKVLSNIVSSQSIHKKYGGVFPMMAKREHQKNLVPVLIEALSKAKLLKIKSLTNLTVVRFVSQLKTIEKILEKENELFEHLKEFLGKYEKPDVDLIAVTYGPGLEPCLWVGVNFAKALSYFWDIPVVPVNHIEAHILVNFLENQKIEFPAISLIVSGGHTQLILMKKIGKYEIIGETRDDAAGECFDKTAKILGLEYPGGPIISKIAAQVRPPLAYRGQTPVKLPRPMINSKDYDFSFSGLKTAVLYATRDKFQSSQELKNKLAPEFVNQMCVEIQQAIIDVLIKKTINAAKNYKAKTIVLGGGVSANSKLRSQFKLKIKNQKHPYYVYPSLDKRSMGKINIIFPNPKLSTDNALMIAVTGYFHRNKKVSWQKLKVNANLRIS